MAQVNVVLSEASALRERAVTMEAEARVTMEETAWQPDPDPDHGPNPKSIVAGDKRRDQGG